MFLTYVGVLHIYVYLQSLSSLATHIEYDVHYKISDFHGGCSIYGCLLGFETVYCALFFPVLEKNVLPSSSGGCQASDR